MTVVEIAIDGVQRSSRYPGGVALRFARVKRYRPDKLPDDADTDRDVAGAAASLSRQHVMALFTGVTGAGEQQPNG